jgi:hypothetical protein
MGRTPVTLGTIHCETGNIVNRRAPKQTSYAGWIAAIIVVLAVVAAGIYLVQRAMHPAASPSDATNSPSAPAPHAQPASTSSTVQHPIAEAAAGPAPASTASLPALSDSDDSVREALLSMVGGHDLGSLLQSQIISRVVATVDALPRQSMGTHILPLRTPKGVMQTEQANGATVITAGNAERYAPYMSILADVDPHALVAWYKHNYPLFQEAYRELGYPRGYFNDRLIAAIDDMLAAPDVTGPVAVVRSGAHYHFADPQWQSLSNGQKLMVRLGPTNEVQFKAKLRMIRTLLVGGQLAH